MTLVEEELMKVFGHLKMEKIPSYYPPYLVTSVNCKCQRIASLPASPIYCDSCGTFTHSAYK